MKRVNYKKALLSALLIVLVFPLITGVFSIQIGTKLHRSKEAPKPQKISIKTWFNGNWQDEVVSYINDHIGCFPLFVKIHNQLEYSFFGNIHTRDIVKGKDNYLFENTYVNALYGKDEIDDSIVVNNTRMLRQLQDTLNSLGKPLVFCMAANKAVYFSELLPKVSSVNTNYSKYLKEFKNQQVNHIDCNGWFLSMKDSLDHALFPQFGIHWSHYGGLLVADTVANKFEGLSGWDLPELIISEKSYSTKPKYDDNDIATSMNLFSSPDPRPLIYPRYSWVDDRLKKKDKKLLMIGDSFMWELFKRSGIGSDCFSEQEFWYYNQTIHKTHEVDSLPTLTRHINIIEKIKGFDAVLIVSNGPNLPQFTWDFVKNTVNILSDSSYVIEERNNAYLKSQCLGNGKWRSIIKDQANKRNISVDSMVSVYLHDRHYKRL